MVAISQEQQSALAQGQPSGSAVQKCAIVVVIDPGHGDKLGAKNPIDPGAVAAGKNEKDIALDVAKVLRSKLQAKTDVIEAVYLTREGDISELRKRLKWRCDIAKEKKANIFVSLHLDSAGPSARGQSVLYHPRYNHSKALAAAVAAQGKIVPSRGAKARDNLYVINLNHFGADTKAAILIELGFISNEADRTACENQKDAITNEITEGLVGFVQANRALFTKT